MPKKHSFEYVKNFIEIESNSGCKLLSTNYINNRTELILICKCGNEFKTNFHEFYGRNKRQCNDCGNIKKGLATKQNLQFTYEYAKECIESVEGYKLISDCYDNAVTDLIIQCPLGHITNMTLAHFRAGCRCKFCANNVKYSLEFAQECFLNKNYTPLFDSYNNNLELLPFICNKHPNEIQYSSLHILMKSENNCSSCRAENNKNENSPNWQGGVSALKNYLRKYISNWWYDSARKSNYRCVLTNDKNIEVHHLQKTFSEIVDETLKINKYDYRSNINLYSNEELNNIKDSCIELHYKYGLGIALNTYLHRLFHSLYRSKDNTLEQFEEFKTRLRLGEFNNFLMENNLKLVI